MELKWPASRILVAKLNSNGWFGTADKIRNLSCCPWRRSCAFPTSAPKILHGNSICSKEDRRWDIPCNGITSQEQPTSIAFWTLSNVHKVLMPKTRLSKQRRELDSNPNVHSTCQQHWQLECSALSSMDA